MHCVHAGTCDLHVYFFSWQSKLTAEAVALLLLSAKAVGVGTALCIIRTCRQSRVLCLHCTYLVQPLGKDECTYVVVLVAPLKLLQ
jgi:hypothetical protein